VQLVLDRLVQFLARAGAQQRVGERGLGIFGDAMNFAMPAPPPSQPAPTRPGIANDRSST
jgi:hypothetical protein